MSTLLIWSEVVQRRTMSPCLLSALYSCLCCQRPSQRCAVSSGPCCTEMSFSQFLISLYFLFESLAPSFHNELLALEVTPSTFHAQLLLVSYHLTRCPGRLDLVSVPARNWMLRLGSLRGFSLSDFLYSLSLLADVTCLIPPFVGLELVHLLFLCLESVFFKLYLYVPSVSVRVPEVFFLKIILGMCPLHTDLLKYKLW